jgi:hypothetical protein
VKRRRITPRPMTLRSNAQRELIARLLLLGWTSERIARHLRCSARAVRYCVSREEFQALFAEYQRDYFKRLDHKMSRLLRLAVDQLAKQLKHPDWRARDAAIEKVLRVHGRYIEKFDLIGTLDHTGHVRQVHQHQLAIAPSMTDEQRTLARQLLESMRGKERRALPPALAPVAQGDPRGDAQEAKISPTTP